ASGGLTMDRHRPHRCTFNDDRGVSGGKGPRDAASWFRPSPTEVNGEGGWECVIVDAAPSPDPRNHRWIFTCAEDERLGCVSEDGSLQRHASCINLECVPKCMDPQILVN